jgi:antitoxin (DNA-binding transcriptional repressor) of toxin-antitoxin stability system
MQTLTHIGLEMARSELPRLVTQAQSGTAAVITRHGRPCAALVSLTHLQQKSRRGGLLSLLGSGAGLWGPDAADAVTALRSEWD